MITMLNELLTVQRRTSVVKSILLLSLLSGLAFRGHAQEETSYLYEGNSMKHYATSQEYNGPGYAMAGTVFDYNGIPGNSGIHLLVDPSPFSASVVYDDVNYDERLIGLHYNSPSAIVMVTSLGNYNGQGTANGIQIIQHPSCNRKYIFAPANYDYWPMGSLLDINRNMLYICGYVTLVQRTGLQPDYTTAKQAFVLCYDLNSNKVSTVNIYQWATTSPLGRDYDMAHRMKFLKNGNIWVAGTCNGAKGPAMMNMIIDPSTLAALVDKPLNTGLASEEYVATSFDMSEDLDDKGYSYIFGNYFYPKSSRLGMYPQPGNYSITAIDANTIAPVPGAKSHAHFISFANAWGTNTVYGNNNNSVILSGYQDAEKCGSAIPSNMDNVNPFLTEAELESYAGDIVINHTKWLTILSVVGTGNTSSGPNSFYELGGGLSNLVFSPITTVRGLYGFPDDVVLSAPIWNKLTDRDLNMKFLKTDQYLTPLCAISVCTPDYEFFDVKVSEKVRERRFDYAVVTPGICPSNLSPDGILDCANDGYFKGAYTAESPKVAYNTKRLVPTLYPNPAHDMFRVTLSGKQDASSGVIIQLADMTGKDLSVLFSGTVSGLNMPIKLPGQLPNGVYMVKMSYNGVKLKAVPLVIH